MAKSKKRPAEETAARPHRVTVILTVAGILATIGVGWFFKASAQTTAVNGGDNGGAIIGINHGTVVAPPATKTCQTAGVHVEGGANIEFKHFELLDSIVVSIYRTPGTANSRIFWRAVDRELRG